MGHYRHGLRERLFHGHSNSDPYDYHNWEVPPSPLGGNRPFPIPPTPSESSASTSASGDEKAHGLRERVRRHKKSRSRSRRRRDSTQAERVVIEDEPMGEEEKSERMGIVRGKGGHEIVGSGSEGRGVPAPPPESEVRRSESKRERKERKMRRGSKSGMFCLIYYICNY